VAHRFAPISGGADSVVPPVISAGLAFACSVLAVLHDHGRAAGRLGCEVANLAANLGPPRARPFRVHTRRDAA